MAIEAALVLIPILAVLTFLVDSSLAVLTRAILQHAVREGVRYAVTGQTRSGFGQDGSIKSVVQGQALGLLAGNTGAQMIHVRYYVPGTLAETASNAGGNIVEVSVEGYPVGWSTTLLRPAMSFHLNARSSDRVEPSPGGIAPPR